MIKKKRFIGLTLGIVAIALMGCPSPNETATWHFPKSSLLQTAPLSESLEVDVYLDATTSMQGFASVVPNNFTQLIDDIELVTKNVWKDTDLRFYKFGTKVDSLSRAQFVQGKNDPKFYADRFTANQVNIDKAVVNTDPERVSIIITDLFYKGQDINSVVAALNESCIKKGIEIGVLTVSAPFTGVVADVTPSVSLKNETRPLYVLIFGNRGNINKVFDAFKSKPYITPNHKLLVSRSPLNDYEVNVIKHRNKDNKAINSDQGAVARYKEHGNVFGFKLKEKDKEGLLDFELTVKADEAFPAFDAGNIQFEVFKKEAKGADSVRTDDLSFRDIRVEGNKIIGKIVVGNKNQEDKFSYRITAGFNNTRPLIMPDWIKNYDTDQYTDSTPKDKTIYLSKLFTEVFTYNTTYNRPVIGKFYLYLRR